MVKKEYRGGSGVGEWISSSKFVSGARKVFRRGLS